MGVVSHIRFVVSVGAALSYWSEVHVLSGVHVPPFLKCADLHVAGAHPTPYVATPVTRHLTQVLPSKWNPELHFVHTFTPSLVHADPVPLVPLRHVQLFWAQIRSAVGDGDFISYWSEVHVLSGLHVPPFLKYLDLHVAAAHPAP